MVISGLAALLFVGVGLWITVHLRVVYPDAVSRLTHAYMVFWNRPAKLAAIGFVWPPLQTLVLLPFVLVKPLATSLVALPLFTGLCGGLLIAVLNRTLTVLDVERRWRYPLLALFAVNPIFLDYASNGMAEVFSLLLLTLGVHYYVTWYLSGGRSTQSLLASGLMMALGFLSRYELGIWMNLMAIGIVWCKRRRSASYREIEAAVLMFLAPVAYMVVIWSALNVAIVGGSPVGWLLRAGGQDQGSALTHPTVFGIAGDSLAAVASISPLLWLVPAALLILGWRRRQRFAVFLALMIVLQAAITFVLVTKSPHTGLLQLRYNLRGLPVALIGAGWLVASAQRGKGRNVTGALLVAVALAAVPIAYMTMRRYPYQYEEQAFARALVTGHDQAGTSSIGHYVIGDPGLQATAAWIDAHVRASKSILVDDASLPEVILLSGRPVLFVTRIDHGDRAWEQVLNDPWAYVRYVLVRREVAGSSYDLIASRYRGSTSGRFPGGTVVFQTRFILIYRLIR